MFALPNGMGSNITRFVWFCLPVAVVATSTRGPRLVAVLLTPVVAGGVYGTVQDLRSAMLPISSVGFYQPLADRLDRIPDVRSYRVEVVNHGAHAAYDALLDHALLARGWETQADTALNRALHTDPLDATTYKVWLDNNAVGYVALPAVSVSGYSEYDLVRSGRAALPAADLAQHRLDAVRGGAPHTDRRRPGSGRDPLAVGAHGLASRAAAR